MKNLFPIALLMAVSIAPAGAETLHFDAPATASGFFDVFVSLTNVFDPPHDTDSFIGYGFDVSFDSSILSYIGETPGALFSDLSGSAGTDVEGFATNVFLNPGDFTEPLQLAVLHFETAGVGPTVIGISGDVSNPNQGLFYLSGSDPISATASLTAVPEPGPGVLLGAGLAALCGIRFLRPRRRNA